MNSFVRILFTLAAVLILASFTLECNRKEDSVKVGQVWKESHYKDNPYRDEEVNYKKVIDISGDYVLYIMNEKDTLNELLYWFVVNSECIENCENN